LHATIAVGAMEEFLARAWDHLVGRLTGPMRVRFLMQPLVAAVIAIRSGPPHSWRDLWRDIGRLWLIAAALDAAYQVVFLGWFYPGQDLIVSVLLAVVPYFVISGAMTRLVRRWRHT
jgi:hypothetical protein